MRYLPGAITGLGALIVSFGVYLAGSNQPVAGSVTVFFGVIVLGGVAALAFVNILTRLDNHECCTAAPIDAPSATTQTAPASGCPNHPEGCGISATKKS